MYREKIWKFHRKEGNIIVGLKNLHRFIIGLGVQIERVDEAFVFAQQETIVDVRDGLVGQGTLNELSPRSYEP